MSRVEELVQQLPRELQQEVVDFARFLLETKAKRLPGRLDLAWRGVLQDERDRYTSVELQHAIWKSRTE